MDSKEYQNTLAALLEARQGWLEKTEFVKCKEDFRTFYDAFVAIYKMLIKKRLIHEDPYKQEAKVGGIEIPPPFVPEGDRMNQLTMNLSAYDNQLDFLVNFTQFNTDFFTLENIKRILGLIRYIDWAHFTVDTQTSTTKALVDIAVQIRTGGDTFSTNLLNESLAKLAKTTGAIMGCLKEATQYARESIKLQIRGTITGTMQQAEATVENIRKKFPAAMPRQSFYPDLADEIVKEDFTPAGDNLRQTILNQLAVPEEQPKAVKAQINFKETLMDGLLIVSSVGVTLGDIAPAMDQNSQIMQNRKQSFFEKLREVFRQMLNREPDPVIYEIEYLDPAKGITVKEKVNFMQFRGDLDKKIRAFAALAGRGPSASKLGSMDEKQLLGILERSVREAQGIHKTLTGLDEFFKTEVPREDREKIRGIKPELSSIKNAIIKANQKRHEYSAQLEEEEHLKRLGVNIG